MIRRGRKPDDEIFVKVLREQWSSLERTAWSFRGSEADVDDLIQQAATNVYAVWKAGRVENLAAYLNMSVRRVGLDLVKRRDRQRPALELLMANADEGEGLDPSSTLLQIEQEERVRTAIAGLTPQCREIIQLRVFDCRSVEDVAEQLLIAKGTVKSRCSRCIEAFETVYRALERDVP